MKKLFRTIAIAALTAVCVGSLAVFAACGNNDDVVPTPDPSEEGVTPEEETPSGDYTATKEVLFSFTGTYCTFDCYNDGTYYFEYTDIPMANESGTWTFTDWVFTVITPSGNEIVAKVGTSESPETLTRDGETYTFDNNELCFFYTSDINSELTDVFYAEASTWGVAIGGQGSYTPIESSGSTDSTDSGNTTTTETLLTVTTEFNSTSVDLVFTSDGNYSVYSGMATGTWTVTEGALTLAAGSDATANVVFKSSSSTDSKINFSIYSVMTVSFTLTSDQLSALGASSVAEVKEAALVLTNVTNGVTSTLTLYVDGTYAFSSVQSDEGSWTIDNNIITLTPNEGTQLTLDTDATTIVATQNASEEGEDQSGDDATDLGYSITIKYYSGYASVTFTYTADQVASLQTTTDDTTDGTDTGDNAENGDNTESGNTNSGTDEGGEDSGSSSDTGADD